MFLAMDRLFSNVLPHKNQDHYLFYDEKNEAELQAERQKMMQRLGVAELILADVRNEFFKYKDIDAFYRQLSSLVGD